MEAHVGLAVQAQKKLLPCVTYLTKLELAMLLRQFLLGSQGVLELMNMLIISA